MKFKDFVQDILIESPSYFRGIDEMMAQSRVPITSKTAKLLGYEQSIKDVYHATEINFLPDLIKIQHSKEHISTFTHNLSNLLSKISVRPDILVKLNGTVIMNFNHDIFSHPDKYGRRWLSTRGSAKSDFLQTAINSKIIKKLLEYSNSPDDDSLLYNDTEYRRLFNDLNKEQKTELVQMYFDNIHRLLKNSTYTKIINEILSKNTHDTKYDEDIVNNFTIKGVYALENGRFEFNHDTAKEQIQNYKLKYLGFLSKSEMGKI